MDHPPLPRQSSRLLIQEPPLQVLPSLACAIGLNEAIFLQQVQYWISRPSAQERDGRRWVYNSYPDWRAQFPFWSVNTIRRTVERLETAGLLLTANYNTSRIDRTKWYTIDYDAVEACYLSLTPGNSAAPSAQNEQTNSSEWADDPPILSRPIPETNTEINNRESAPGKPLNVRPVVAADDSSPAVVVKVPPGTPVNRRPDAPAVHPVPKPERAAASLAQWQPGPDEQAWWTEQCQDAPIPSTAIDVALETKKWREAESSQTLKPGQYARYWRMWMLRAIDRWRDRQASAPARPVPQDAAPPARYKTRKA